MEKYIKKRNTYSVHGVASQMSFENRLQKEEAKKTPADERPHAPRLSEMGKMAYFEEYYNGIKLENQVFPKIGIFDDPRETTCFKRGYARGAEMVSTAEKLNNLNIIPVEYRELAQKRFTK